MNYNLGNTVKRIAGAGFLCGFALIATPMYFLIHADEMAERERITSEQKIHHPAQLLMQKYDTDRNGFLDKSELEHLAKDYNLQLSK